MAKKTTNENQLKAKLGIFIEEQITTSVESLWKGTVDHESFRTTALDIIF